MFACFPPHGPVRGGRRTAPILSRSWNMVSIASNGAAERSEIAAPMEFRIANTIDLWDQAFALTYHRYREKGLISPNPWKRRVTAYHLQPQTNVFVAMSCGRVVATATVVSDTPAGLPIDSIYQAEMDEFRDRHVPMGEVTCLACGAMGFKESQLAVLGMMRLLGQHSKRFGIEQLVAAVHPKHARFYVRTMGFRYFGAETTYENMHDAPAVGCCMNFREVERTQPRFYAPMLQREMRLVELLPHPLTPEASAYFQPMVEASRECVPLSA